MAIALISSCSNGGNANTVTSTNADTSGANLLIVGVADYSAVTLGTVTDSKSSNTWNTLTSSNATANVRTTLFWCIPANVGSGHNFTYTVTGSFPSIGMLAFSGAITSSPVDTGATGSGQSGAANSALQALKPGSITGSVAGDLFVTAIGLGNENNISNLAIDSSFTIETGMTVAPLAGNHWGYSMAWKVDSGTSAQDPNWTWTTAVSAASRMAVFKPPSSGSKLFLPANLITGAGGPFFSNPVT